MIRTYTRHFFIRISYDGSKYSGVRWNPDVKTVESTLSDILNSYVGKGFNLRTSSRTDKGVHAVSNVLKLNINDPTIALDAKHLAYILNYKLWKDEEDIRVLDVQELPFYKNSVELIKRRVYVYRLAVFKELLFSMPKDIPVNNVRCRTLPKRGVGNIFHEKSCVTLSPPFSIDKLIESAEIMSGVNNIYNCTTSSGHREMNRKVAGNKSYIRNIQIDIKRGHPMMLNLQPRMADKVEFWEIHFKSHSYIYKQIRRMVGYMVGYAQGEYSLELLRKTMSGQQLLDKESVDLARADTTFTMPPQGLFLQNVELDEDKISEKEINNSYIELLANLGNLSFILYKNSTKHKQATLQRLSETPPAQVVGLDSFSIDPTTALKLKGKDANAYSVVQSGLGMVKVDIY